jgi:hypothetical protein
LKRTYRSKLEAQVAADLGKTWEYEPGVIEYTQKKDYLIDFKNGKYVVEVKGFFRSGDSSKYRAVADACKEQGYVFIMLFAKPNAPIRKDARTTYRSWAEKHGILWFDTNNIHKLKQFIANRTKQ